MNDGNAIYRFLGPLAPDFIGDWGVVLTASVIGVTIVIAIVGLIALAGTWAERKVSAHIQCRYGPMYVGGWHGWAQALADGIKLISKEDMIPIGADRMLFMLAPSILLGSVFAALCAMPLAPAFYFGYIDLGVFMILAFSSLTTIGVVMAGWASNSKWSLYGAMREAAQVVAYEIPLGISLLAPLLVVGTFNLIEASNAQADYFGMGWLAFKNPFVLAASVIFFIAVLAETKRAPFDLPEAESELVAGFLTEYSGIRWSLFFMEEYAAMFLMSVLTAFFFFGGFESPFSYLAMQTFGDGYVYQVICFLTLVVKGSFGIFLMMWLRWTLPRLRIDQVMTMGYKYLTPLALVCVLGAGVWEAIKHAVS
jgi:NADH-quinone oxidoreductase subunit H